MISDKKKMISLNVARERDNKLIDKANSIDATQHATPSMLAVRTERGQTPETDLPVGHTPGSVGTTGWWLRRPPSATTI
ncbi:hypothetical protein ACQR1Y_22920 [Bradyrhizobium sp. HKCCYLRH3099]|uniref:hypothetical protein n=1 Tax=unclassified Bradyrhizobium TaxID=2631580 RepID=UPI003EBF551C